MMRRKRDIVDARRHGAAKPQEIGANETNTIESSSRTEDEHNCGCAGAGLPLLAEVCETSDEILAICVLRFVLAGYSHDRAQCLDAAVDAAAAVHGEQYGLTLMTRALAVVRALRAERNGNYQYMPSNCSRVSEDEQELIEAMAAVKEQNQARVSSAVTTLSKSNHAPRIMQAVWAFAITVHMLPDLKTDAALFPHKPCTLH